MTVRDEGLSQLLSYMCVCVFSVQDMNSAVITPCSHFFHAGCLKKWLYVQETCPLCHSQLKSQTASAPNQDASAANQSAEAAAKNEEKSGAAPADEENGTGDASRAISAGEGSSAQTPNTSSPSSSPPSTVTESPTCVSCPSSSPLSPPSLGYLSSQSLVRRRIPAEASVCVSSKPDLLSSTSGDQCPTRCL